jgi:hypothetical protein
VPIGVPLIVTVLQPSAGLLFVASSLMPYTHTLWLPAATSASVRSKPWAAR